VGDTAGEAARMLNTEDDQREITATTGAPHPPETKYHFYTRLPASVLSHAWRAADLLTELSAVKFTLPASQSVRGRATTESLL